MEFHEFRHKYGDKDLGILEAVGEVLYRYRREARYPKHVDKSDQEKFKYIFQQIDRTRISKKLLVTEERTRNGEAYEQLVKRWRYYKSQEKQKKPNYSTETEPLIVFFYFMHRWKNEDKNLDNRYGVQIKELLNKEGFDKEREAWKNPKKENKDISFATVISDPEEAQKDIPDWATKIDIRNYQDYPNEAVEEYVFRHFKKNVDDIFFDRQEWTDGDAASDPEGIIASLIRNGRYGLHMSEQYRNAARREFKTPKVIERLPILVAGYPSRRAQMLFSNPAPDSDEIFFDIASFDDPPNWFMKHALECIGNADLIKALEEEVEDDLTFAIFRCIVYRREGRNTDLCAFFFDNLSRIEKFSLYTRGISSFLKSVFDTLRGAVDEAYKASTEADNYLSEFFRSSDYYGEIDQTLLARVSSQKLINLYGTTSLFNLDDNRIGQMAEALVRPIGLAGLHEHHFEKPEFVADRISKSPARARSIYIASLFHYHIEILRCIKDKTDASEFFFCHKVINCAYAEIEPDTACTVLTPMIALAEIAGLHDIALELYKWRHDGHLIENVNVARKGIDQTTSLGIEPALDLLLTYNLMRNRMLARPNDVYAEERMNKTRDKLLRLEDQFMSLELKTISRYYARFKADLTGDKMTYLQSECHNAPSHFLYLGRWNDSFSEQ